MKPEHLFISDPVGRQGVSLPRPALAADAGLAALPDHDLRALCHSLPKIDLHRHLEGAITPEALIPIARKFRIALPAWDAEALRPFIQVGPEDRSLVDFLKKFHLIGRLFTSPAAVEELTYACIADAARDNVRYLELRFSPVYMASEAGLNPKEVMSAVCRAARQGREDLGIVCPLIVLVERQLPIYHAWQAEHLAEMFQDQGVTALDLANDEAHYPPGPFAPVFQRAKRAGLKITVHAGEAAGPENIHTAVLDLCADRIGHGVRAREDSAVIELLRERRIPLELCFTSNLQTLAVASPEDYPLRFYDQAGVIVTIHTDDPGVCGVQLTDELFKLVRLYDFSLNDLRRFTQNSAKAAFGSVPQLDW